MAFVIVLWENRKSRRVGKENGSSVFQDSKPLKLGSRSLLRGADPIKRHDRLILVLGSRTI
jgi:hypothetical protein